MAKISFHANIYHEGFTVIAEGSRIIFRETVRLVDKSVHSWPYLFMAAEAFLLIVLSFVYIGQARAGRDYINKSYWELQQKTDSLAVSAELWYNMAKKKEMIWRHR